MSFSSTLLRAFALAGALSFSTATLAQDADVPGLETLTIAATPVPHAEILNFIKPELAKQGVNLVVREFTDYVQPAMQTNERNVDGNFFQHEPYLIEFKREHKDDRQKIVARIHIEPFGAYSSRYKVAADLPDGATIAIPNDPSNSGRALLLLARQQLIKLQPVASDVSATQRDILENPKKFKFREIEAAMLPRVLPEVDLALINTNYAIDAKLNPLKDALFIEDAQSPYTNILVARTDNANRPAMKKLAAALQTDAVRKFILEKYQGAVVPAF